MVYSHRQRAHSAAPGTARHNAVLKKKTKAPYKVVFEQVTEKRRKLLTVLSFDENPPPGYTFVAAGDPQITNRCKQVAREVGLKVFIVSTSKHKLTGILSHEVHRTGHHFPSFVVEKACTSLGVSLTKSGHVLPAQRYQQTSRHSPRPRNEVNSYRSKRIAPLQEDVSQATLDTQAREAIKDLFPKIPEKDLHDIIYRAFEKGKDRVGTVLDLPLSRRVQLAVVAHIRHVYTDYDKLLKTGTFKNARAAIEKPCLDILAQWRSDDDDDPNAMEEILREVIVIDDDDEENKDNEIPFETHESVNRDDSIEIISSHVLPEEVQMHQSDYGGPTQRIRGDRSYNPGVEDRETLRYTNPEQLRSNHHSRSNLPPLDRSGVHHHRWQEALHRQRANPLFIHSDKHDELVQRLEISPRAPTFYTEAEPRQLRLEHQARELLPLEKATYNQHQNLPYLDIKGNENPAKEGLDFPNGNLHPDPLRLREVVIPAEAHMSNNGQNNGQRLVEPRSSQRIRRNSNDYVQYGQPGDPRLTTSEEEITHVRDKIPRRVLIDATHNPQPRHPLHQNPGERLRSAEGKIFGTNNVENPFKVSNERSPNYLDESHRFDRRIDFGSRNIHVNDDIETHNRKRRRVEELAPISSERFRQHQDHPHPQRTVLIPLHTDDGWSDSHQQLSPSVQLSTVNPFIRRHPDVYARPVNAMRNADREMLPHSRQHEASGAGREPVRDFGSAENFHPSSHSVRNVPAVPQQIQQDSLYSAFEAPRKVSSIPSFRDDHIRLQSSYIPFNSSKSSRHDYDHSTSGFPSRGHIDTVEHRAADQRRHEQELPSNFARLATRSRYDSGHSKSTHDGFETHRATLVPTEWDRALTPLRGEARTGVFLRKLPDESRMIRDDARLRTSRSRLLHKENISPRSDANNLMPFDAGTRDPQTWTPVRGQAETNLWQSTSKLADDQRYDPGIERMHHAEIGASTPAQPGELIGGPAGRRGARYADVPGWESREPREIIVID